MSRFRQNIAIDLGTASVLVYDSEKGVVVNEPSVVAMDAYNNKILAVGNRAKKMLGKTPGNIIATKPMKDGVIADFNATEKMLSYFMKRALGKSFFKPNVIICVPSQSTQVEKRAVLQASAKAGANRTYLIEESMAAAIGAGVEISDSTGKMIIDIGGGTTDIAVISMGGIVINKSIDVGGDKCDIAIGDYLRKKFNILIGERTAEDIKISIATATLEGLDENLYEVRGRSLINGLPINVFVTSTDIFEALKPVLDVIVKAIHDVLDKTPPELAGDIFDGGIVMTGGGALIHNLDKRISDSTGLDVIIADDPISAVVKGTGKSIKWIDQLETDDKSYVEARQRTIKEQEALRRR